MLPNRLFSLSNKPFSRQCGSRLRWKLTKQQLCLCPLPWGHLAHQTISNIPKFETTTSSTTTPEKATAIEKAILSIPSVVGPRNLSQQTPQIVSSASKCQERRQEAIVEKQDHQ